MSFLAFLRLILGAVYVLFAPGFVLSYAFFPKRQIGPLERTILSLALSIAIVPLFFFILNRAFSVAINELTSFLGILAIITLGLFFIVRQRRLPKERK